MSFNNEHVFNLGLVVWGNFGLFAVENFLKTNKIKFIRVTDNNSEIDKITQPYLHYEKTIIISLKSNKPVICEKPIKTKLKDAQEIVKLAKLIKIDPIREKYQNRIDFTH